jgi:hypothetical protein
MWIDIIGYAAALAVLCSFCMSTIVPLRLVAILSNLLFAAYGLLAHLYPVFLLHSVLLPINVFKLARNAGRSLRLPAPQGPSTMEANDTSRSMI